MFLSRFVRVVAVRHEQLISAIGKRRHTRHVVGSHHCCTPPSNAKIDVAVCPKERHELAEVGDAACDVTSTGLCEHGLATLTAQPVSDGLKGGADEVVYTLCVAARTVRVEVLVKVEDEVSCGTIRVADA